VIRRATLRAAGRGRATDSRSGAADRRRHDTAQDPGPALGNEDQATSGPQPGPSTGPAHGHASFRSPRTGRKPRSSTQSCGRSSVGQEPN
jgi:hypothetical protein